MAGIAFGNTRIGCVNKDPYSAQNIRSCPVGTILADGSSLICKAGGVAWFVAPASSQISLEWVNGTYNNYLPGRDRNQPSLVICCTSEWPPTSTCLSDALSPRFYYTASQWFIPTYGQLLDPGYVCRSRWNSYCNVNYWSATEGRDFYFYNVYSNPSEGTACAVNFSDGATTAPCKACPQCVRAFKCITY